MPQPRPSRTESAQCRILVRGVNWLGDAVMTTPALRRLRERFPQGHLALLTSELLADLWRGHPGLDQVITFAAGESPWSIGRRLRGETFDQALVLPNSPRSALEVWLGRIPERIGYARPWRNGFLTQAIPPAKTGMQMRKRSVGEIRRLTQDTPERPPSLSAPVSEQSPAGASHQIHHYLGLAAALGADAGLLAPKLEVASEEWGHVRAKYLAPLGAKTGKVLGLNPSAAYGPAKRWPARNFAAAAREISRLAPDAVWLVFGAPSDRGLCEEIAQHAGGRALNLAGKTSLRELMALLKLCRVLVTNDSGPMHVAAALGTPVVVPFGSTSPELTGPGLPGAPGHYVLRAGAACAPCYRRVCPIDFRCMQGITVERVVSAVRQALGSQPSGPGFSGA